ncbi:MAG: nucleotidyltransferase domain-containing protein [Oscillospiraceae bacterium]|nr:nucleotidyltransferase domain-containing protein [Oscillospiraceae bacterium]
MNLKDIRLRSNLTQEEAAQLLGVTRRTYVNYEAGKIDESSLKYKYVVETLQKATLIDENHGILTIDQIRKTCGEIFKDYSVEYCYLFGSYAKGKATEKSDVDLLVAMPVDGMKFFELIEVLREQLKKKIDLLDIAQLENNPALVQEILRDGIKIYG